MSTRFEPYLDFFRKDPRAPLLITVMLALFLILTIEQMITTFTAATSSALISARNTPSSLPNIGSTHLFGNYNQSMANLPQTQLQLSLQGIELAMTPGDSSYVLIGTPNQATKVYQAGDSVPGGAVIHTIFRDRVILDDNGRLESLNLPVPKTTGMITSATPIFNNNLLSAK